MMPDNGISAEAVTIGLMSGTSLDGIDAAIVQFDGGERPSTGATLTAAYDPGLRRRIRAVLGRRGRRRI